MSRKRKAPRRYDDDNVDASSRLILSSTRIKRSRGRPRKYIIQVDHSNRQEKQDEDQDEDQDENQDENQDEYEEQEQHEEQLVERKEEQERKTDFFNLYVANNSLGISLGSLLSISLLDMMNFHYTDLSFASSVPACYPDDERIVRGVYCRVGN